MPFVDWFFAFWLSRLRYPWSRLRRKLCEGRYLRTGLPSVGSLEEVALHLREVTWAMDGLFHLYDAISYPETVWAKKKDDCDGFAVLAAELLKRWDPATNPVLVTVMVRPAKSSHTVCAFKEGEDIRGFNNATLEDGRYESYLQIAEELSSGADRLVCWDVADPTALRTLEFHRA